MYDSGDIAFIALISVVAFAGLLPSKKKKGGGDNKSTACPYSSCPSCGNAFQANVNGFTCVGCGYYCV